MHNNWGDIFFDLFYVALAYNLGNVLREDPTNQGFLYLCACFLPLIGLWQLKLFWDSRFVNGGEDIFHVLVEVANYACVASAVQHVRPVAVLSDLENNIDMFAFCLSILIGHILCLGRLVEVVLCARVFKTDGLYEEAVPSIKRDFWWMAVSPLFYLAACIYSGKEYFGSSSSEGSSYEKASSVYEADDHHHDDHNEDHRFLAGTTSSFYTSTSENDTAAWLCLAGALSSLLVHIVIGLVWFPAMKRAGIDVRTYVH